jgi:hypothetical protein
MLAAEYLCHLVLEPENLRSPESRIILAYSASIRKYDIRQAQGTFTKALIVLVLERHCRKLHTLRDVSIDHFDKFTRAYLGGLRMGKAQLIAFFAAYVCQTYAIAHWEAFRMRGKFVGGHEHVKIMAPYGIHLKSAFLGSRRNAFPPILGTLSVAAHARIPILRSRIAVSPAYPPATALKNGFFPEIGILQPKSTWRIDNAEILIGSRKYDIRIPFKEIIHAIKHTARLVGEDIHHIPAPPDSIAVGRTDKAGVLREL